MAERVAHPGPQDRSVLFMLPDEHRANRVWHESSFRDVKLKCHHYSREAYVEEGPRHPEVVQLLRVSGFHGVERIGQLQSGVETGRGWRWPRPLQGKKFLSIYIIYKYF
ncbi:unnamed protein product [Cuscuta epithymum]|uniref:Uncharacterized protein n=1 Tax=Cuscuta epithymum TaxID=186058 RepID=A0AAV0GJ66_9ASTE|nr:unnamed protein product [Cuscuta epithymum]